MMQQRKIWRRIGAQFEAQNIGLPLKPLIEVVGFNRVLIENHNGVTQYCGEKICVKVSCGEICIMGAGLELAQMCKEQLVICGRIDDISLHKGRK